MLNKGQEQQFKEIAKEFRDRDIVVWTYTTALRPQFDSITVAYAGGDEPIVNWYKDFDEIHRDIKKFGIQMSAEYLLEMLRRKGIYGVAIHSERDEPDSQFGAFVAWARLLKHIKKTEAKQ